MNHKSHVRLMAIVVVMICAIPCYAEDLRLPPKIVKIEPVQARVDVLGCGGPSVSLNLPKWKCDKEHHGEIIAAYRVTYVRGHQKFVTVLPYRPDEESKPVEASKTGFEVDIVLREIN